MHSAWRTRVYFTVEVFSRSIVADLNDSSPIKFQQSLFHPIPGAAEKLFSHWQNPLPYLSVPSLAGYFRVGGHNFTWWGEDNCMWSNDYPHPNSTWPNSREVIARDLGQLPPDLRKKLLCDNVAGVGCRSKHGYHPWQIIMLSTSRTNWRKTASSF